MTPDRRNAGAPSSVRRGRAEDEHNPALGEEGSVFVRHLHPHRILVADHCVGAVLAGGLGSLMTSGRASAPPTRSLRLALSRSRS